MIADARHAVTNCHARKPGATIEGRPADARHAVRDCYTRKPGATIEGFFSDARHTTIVRNDACVATQNQSFGCRFNKTVAGTMIFCVAVCNCNAHKSGATNEGRIADARYAVTDCHARKPGALIEGFFSDARHAVRDCYARKIATIREGIRADARHAIGDCYVSIFSVILFKSCALDFKSHHVCCDELQSFFVVIFKVIPPICFTVFISKELICVCNFPAGKGIIFFFWNR